MRSLAQWSHRLHPVLTFCFCMGNNEDAIDGPPGQGYNQVFFGATDSHAKVTIMAVIILPRHCALVS